MFGARKSSLKYVIRYNRGVVMPHPTLVLNRPYSTLEGSVAGEQALQLSHTHPLFRCDNEQFYGILEEAVGTVYEAKIMPFQRRAYGRGSYLVLIAQHTGRDKWIAILRTAKELLSTCVAESDAHSMQGRNHDHLPASGRA